MTENERALLRKLTISVAALLDFMGRSDPFGKLGQAKDEIVALMVAVDKDASSPPPRKPR